MRGIVKRFNRTLAEQLFGHQYTKELLSPRKRNMEWVARLLEVAKALNEETMRLILTKDGREIAPAQAIELSRVKQLPAAPVIESVEEIPPNSVVRYLYYPGEQDSGTVRRATDPVWSVDAYQIEKRTSQFKKNGKKVTTGPTLYYLLDGPKRSFVRQELQIVPEDTELPPKTA